ncbi:hypothetical protein J3459_010601 [Metarhizium acridum]|nr:hypothetical protein J3459_010601 [Metarhizium acridum]
MSTPTSFFISPPDADEISARLQKEASRQDETTPEPVFRYDPDEQAFKWLCEIHHGNFTCDEVDDIRMEICDAAYWEREAEHLKTICIEMIRKNLYLRSAPYEAGTSMLWRNRCLALRRLLKDMGLDSQEFYLQRLSIADQNYWKSEEDRLKRILAVRELEIQERFLTKAAGHGIPSPPENGTEQMQKKPPRKRTSPRSVRPQPQQAAKLRRSARLSGTNASKVEKRSGKVGGNCCHTSGPINNVPRC